MISDWTVDYGHGPSPISLPHAWSQEVPVTWEGPATYGATILLEDPSVDHWLVFDGVSYEARVWFDDEFVGVHRGIWDAFSFRLPKDRATIQLRVEVTKNGGERFPVREVASGFLPFVFQTFGGIYRGVRVITGTPDPLTPRARPNEPAVQIKNRRLVARKSAPPDPREQAQAWLARRQGVSVESSPASTDWQPLYLRGVLTWGWYPELGYPNPTDEIVQRETQHLKKLGFNLVKFCLWIPSHRHLEQLERAGIWAWIELPLWDPTPNPDRQADILDEFRRIARQYRHHSNIALWTAGCELNETTSAEFRRSLYEMIRNETGCPLVRDNSGSAEMYGGDLREFADFYDFHPYGEPNFYPAVLESLRVGPREHKPILLGEFNDIDVHRDLVRITNESPYWASSDEALNAQGVRWQFDLPKVLLSTRWAKPDALRVNDQLSQSSQNKALFMRKFVQETVRSMDDFAGYVVTGWRDTPISSSGFEDDWGQLRYRPEDLAAWNGLACLFLIPTRRPPWIHGGNRPGWLDPHNVFEGSAFWRVGIHSETERSGTLEWDLLHFSWTHDRRPRGRVAQGTAEPRQISALQSQEVGQIHWETEEPGGYLLRVRFDGVENRWPVWVQAKPRADDWLNWTIRPDPDGRLTDLKIPVSGPACPWGVALTGPGAELWFIDREFVRPKPFWRESAYVFDDDSFWERLGFREHWERWLPIATDRVLDLTALQSAYPDWDWEPKLTRVDTRTYEEDVVLVEGIRDKQRRLVTTLRPDGGLGIAPIGLRRNPAGYAFLNGLRLRTLEARS